ncbi:GbsR/MarR family transcriptional regulator [Actinoallomurus iriomotensis]|uniref:MarR family transcriptional regulator n=1 Tax=Actinoallomurus iriomotensis TaxID=478107 RepID=A0A9W6RSR9_9ACTN|nr:MarR family transcriptional regulator [Actinoallomurus iriomotensis]GLY81154.1 MarR family transcriptional regulator [Actinoallomurus iriomotensis]
MAERDPEAVRQFVERFASALVDAGFQRMPARVFAVLHGTDSGRLTASEIAEQLQVSPAAVSGAVRFLIQFNMIRREREPGSRRDVFVVENDSWYEAIVNRDEILRRWSSSAREGIEVLGADTPAGRRMATSLAFFEFITEELEELIDRWQKAKAERLPAED